MGKWKMFYFPLYGLQKKISILIFGLFTDIFLNAFFDWFLLKRVSLSLEISNRYY